MNQKVILNTIISDNFISLKRNKNKMILRHDDICKIYPFFKGLTYEYIKNKNSYNIICNVDLTKITENNNKKLYQLLLETFNKNANDKMFKYISCDTFCFSTYEYYMKYVYPKNNINFGKIFLNDKLDVIRSIKFKRKRFIGSVVVAYIGKICELQNKLPSQLHVMYDGKSIKKHKNKIIYITYKHIDKIHVEINELYEPCYIWIILTKAEFEIINHKKIFDIITWSTDSENCGKSFDNLVNVYEIKNDIKPVKDFIQIDRHKLVLNDCEYNLIKNLSKYNFDNNNILNIYNQLNFIKNNSEKTTCDICANLDIVVKLSCGHTICINCTVSIFLTSNEPKCPFCRKLLNNLNELTINSIYYPSLVQFIIKQTRGYKKPIIYVENIKNAEYINNFIENSKIIKNCELKELINIKNVVLIGIENDDDNISNISGVDAIFCSSSHDRIITNCKYYGKDFIDRTNKIKLILYSYDF